MHEQVDNVWEERPRLCKEWCKTLDEGWRIWWCQRQHSCFAKVLGCTYDYNDAYELRIGYKPLMLFTIYRGRLVTLS